LNVFNIILVNSYKLKLNNNIIINLIDEYFTYGTRLRRYKLVFK